MNNCTCARCGESITAPYYFQGQYYGWSCIKIVNPASKRGDRLFGKFADSYTIEFRNKSKIIHAVLDNITFSSVLSRKPSIHDHIILIQDKAFILNAAFNEAKNRGLLR